MTAQKPKAIIVDLDGTYCNHNHRGELWIMHPRPVEQIQREILNDATVDWCNRIIDSYAKDGYKIIFLTARTHDFEECTREWLQKVAGQYDHELVIRNVDEPMDKIHDAAFKGIKLLTSILPRYDVELAIDDKQSCCQVFRAHGITTLHCSNLFI